ncbi:MAG TPA: GMC oxidoreductase [Polyangiales bacterium]|nr:GMC oxidoreductase [Polyangiales bacterium]
MKARVERVKVTALKLPTEIQPEFDGTQTWSATTMILVECSAQGVHGLGYTYSHLAAAKLVEDVLVPCIDGLPVMAHGGAFARMEGAVRNLGRDGIAATAISAVDVALWDLKARLLGVPLGALLGLTREAVPAYARLEAAGGHDIFHDEDTAHLMGGCRMGVRPEDSVTNSDGRSWEIDNPWICDGSLMPTGGDVNPSLTIMANAARIADRIRALAARGARAHADR